MFKNRRNLKKFVCGCLLILGCLVPSIRGLAAESGSITISYHGHTDDETVVLSEIPFVLYQIGMLGENGWKLSEDFQESGVSLENPDSSERKKQAEKLYTYAKKKHLRGMEQKTNSSGITKFENLEKGLYLIAQMRDARKGNWIFRSAPFLVSIPGGESDTVVWDMVIEPKSEWDEIGTGGGGGSGSGSGGNTDDGNHGGGSGGSTDGGNLNGGNHSGGPGEGTVVIPGGETIETSQAEESESNPQLAEEKEIVGKGKTPKTGDTSFLEIWMLVLGISAGIVGLIIWMFVRIRISENKESDHSEIDKKTKKR